MERNWRGRRLLTLLMVAVLLVSIVPMHSAMAEEATEGEEASDAAPVCETCGNNPCTCVEYGTGEEVQCAVRFLNWDGTLLDEIYVSYGEVPVYDKVPEREGTRKVSYVFAGWEPALAPVEEDTVYWATYKEVSNLSSMRLYVSCYGTVDANQSFLVDVYDGYQLVVTVAVDGNGYVDLDGLTIGHMYTLKLRNTWSWRYHCEASVLEVVIAAEGTVAGFQVTRYEEHWLDENAPAVTKVTYMTEEEEVSGSEE